MACTAQSLQPADHAAVQQMSDQRRAHRDHALALRLYARMKHRSILLLHPVPRGIKEQIAAWLHRDGLVLVCSTYTSGNGRRLRCEAQAFTPEQWWRHGQASWARVPMPGLRLVSTSTHWPAPTGPRQMWPELAF